MPEYESTLPISPASGASAEPDIDAPTSVMAAVVNASAVAVAPAPNNIGASCGAKIANPRPTIALTLLPTINPHHQARFV